MSIKASVLLLLDGEVPGESLLRSIAANASFIIATDGAAQTARKYSTPLDVIIGDMDSLPKDVRKVYEDKGIRIIEEGEQYSNDFEKALRYILTETHYKDVIVLGIHGKRTGYCKGRQNV